MTNISLPAIDEKAFSNEEPQTTFVPFEKIIGFYDNKLPIVWLEQLTKVSDAVARIRVPGGYGTGWLVGRNLMLTNNHVINTNDTARRSVAQFGYQKDINGVLQEGVDVRIVELLATDAELDYALLSLEGSPGDSYGYIDIRNTKPPIPGDQNTAFPVVIQHPDGGPKMWSGFENKLENADETKAWYSSDTKPGSSGSVVLAEDLTPFALHHAGGYLSTGNGQMFINEGILLSAIVKHLREEHPGLLAPNIPSRERFGYAVCSFLNSQEFRVNAGAFITIESEQNKEGIWDRVRDRVINRLLDDVLGSEEMMECFDQLQAEESEEIVPVIVAAAGVLSGAGVAHWAHSTSHESVEAGISLSKSTEVTIELGLGTGFQFSVENVTGPSSVFSAGYQEIVAGGCTIPRLPLSGVLDWALKLEKTNSKLEAFPLAGIYLAGVAAGSLAYSRGK